MTRPLCAIVLATALGLTAAPAAGAAVRFATPTGAGAACSEAAPCSSAVAIFSAGNGDEVILAAGDYPALSTQQTMAGSGVSVHGASRSARAVLHVTGAGQLCVLSPNVLSDLDIVSDGMFPALKVMSGGVAERLRIASTGTGGSGGGVEIYDGTLRDSTVFVTAPNTTAVQTRPNGNVTTATLRNDTIVATGSGSTAYGVAALGNVGSTTANLTNVILVATGMGGIGLVSSTGGGTSAAQVNLDHSNIESSAEYGAAVLTDVGGSQFQTPVKLADIAHGDFHQLPSSPTVDAGRDAAANGVLDVDGDARQIATTDIGADELVPAPPAGPIVGGTPPPAGPGTNPAPRAKLTLARVAARTLTVRRRRVAVRLICPASGTGRCAGRLTVTVGGRATAPVRYSVARGRRLVVRVRLTPAQATRVGRAGRGGMRASVRLARGARPVRVRLRRA